MSATVQQSPKVAGKERLDQFHSLLRTLHSHDIDRAIRSLLVNVMPDLPEDRWQSGLQYIRDLYADRPGS